ncbi:Hypothetical protein, putative [Bodo saltans]|uniref:Prenyltransferase alpha-alpha toroid domain-containing protein n=1 Tax=Bodo saltans TaxID=75058 RepID=A0A0S4JBT7_BODSA|nr:Hypothetical protein, putative [Bodo saltans]|eukprot:CUG87421.1 Hypothetical protein, putative [Bodo saltans]
MYFGVLGSRIGGSAWASDAHSPQNTLIAHALRACYDVGVGGFYAEPIEQYVGTVTLTMTHCALHILWITGQLEAALNDWLQPSSIHSFVLSCLVRTKGSEENNNSDEGVVGAFAAFAGSSEVDVRFTYSALMILLMLHAQ